MSTVKGYAAPSATSPLGAFGFERREPGPQRRRDRHPVLRRLPLRPAHRPQRVARNTVYPCVPGHEIVGRVTAVGGEVTKLQGRRPGRRRLHGRLLPHLPRLPGRASSSSAEAAPIFTYNSPDTHLGGMTYGGYSNRIVVDEAFVLRDARRARPGRRARRCCAPASRPTRRCATGSVGAGQEGRHRRPRRPRPHGREVRPRLRRARRRCSRPRPARPPTRRRLGADEVVVSTDADADEARTPAASTSSSTRSRPRTTSTPTPRC